MVRPRRLSAAVAAILLLTCANAAAAQPGKSTDELIKDIVEHTPKARAPTDNAIMQMVNEAQKKDKSNSEPTDRTIQDLVHGTRENPKERASPPKETTVNASVVGGADKMVKESAPVKDGSTAAVDVVAAAKTASRKENNQTNNERINRYIHLLGNKGEGQANKQTNVKSPAASPTFKNVKSPAVSSTFKNVKSSVPSSSTGKGKGNSISNPKGSSKFGSSKSGKGGKGSSKGGKGSSKFGSKAGGDSKKSNKGGKTPSPSPTASAPPTKSKKTKSPIALPSQSPAPTFSASPAAPSDTPTPTSTPAQTQTPSPGPSVLLSTRSPTFEEINPNCPPTEGPCIPDEVTLNRVLTFAPDGSTLALCGGDIDLTDQITIDISNVTLCCAGTTVFCNLFAAPNQRVLEVSGDSITIQDIRFFDGMSQDPGGNLFISAFGDHRLIRTGFFNGETDTAGGNVYITAPDGTLRVENSTFTEGTSGQQGGGLAVDGPVSVIIVDSVFSNNFSNQGGGGGLAITRGSDQSSGQTIVVESSEFAFNQAVLGAGFVFTTLGVGPTISVSSSRFMDNMADQSGGAGVFGQALEEIALSVENNSGSGNSAGDALLCNDFLAINGTTQRPVCIAVDETFTDP